MAASSSSTVDRIGDQWIGVWVRFSTVAFRFFVIFFTFQSKSKVGPKKLALAGHDHQHFTLGQRLHSQYVRASPPRSLRQGFVPRTLALGVMDGLVVYITFEHLNTSKSFSQHCCAVVRVSDGRLAGMPGFDARLGQTFFPYTLVFVASTFF